MAPLFRFYALACLFSWPFALLMLLLPPSDQLPRLILGVLFMFGPALATVVVRRLDDAPLKPLVAFGAPNAVWLVAWFAPLIIAFFTVLVSLLVPGVTLDPGLSGALGRLEAILSPEELAAAKQQLDEMPPWMWVAVLVVQPLIAGASINAIAAFGEELGWRGQAEEILGHQGFWRRSALVGTLWGLWHTPMILQGHNYPQHPAVGVLMMTVFCVLLAPLHTWVRQAGGSVWTAALLHGSINATAGIPLLLLAGGNDLTVGLTGLPGFVVLLGVNLVLWRLVAVPRSRP
jgi:uncharacterized protein